LITKIFSLAHYDAVEWEESIPLGYLLKCIKDWENKRRFKYTQAAKRPIAKPLSEIAAQYKDLQTKIGSIVCKNNISLFCS